MGQDETNMKDRRMAVRQADRHINRLSQIEHAYAGWQTHTQTQEHTQNQTNIYEPTAVLTL